MAEAAIHRQSFRLRSRDVQIHHLDAGPMRPPLIGRWLNDQATLVCHVLAIETPAGDLALVDTGIGLAARRDPRSRFGAVPARDVPALPLSQGTSV